MSERCIFHVDCNSFFASSSLFYRPWLQDKPVAIGGREDLRHGIVVAANPIAKSFGVKTAMTLYEARRMCRDLIVLPAEHERYSQHSQDIKNYLAQYAARIRSFGADEGWYDVTETVKHTKGGAKALAEKVLSDIPRLFGITVSIGVSWNWVFAKLGSDMKKPNAITYIQRSGPNDTAWQSIVFPLPVQDLLYVGHATQLRLNYYGVRTIGDLANEPLDFLVGIFGKNGNILHAFANGHDCGLLPFEGHEDPIKSVGSGCTTKRDLVNDNDIHIVTSSLTEDAASRLRKINAVPRTISYYARDAKSLGGYSRQAKLQVPTNRTAPLTEAVYNLFTSTHRWEGPLRSFRVRFSDLEGENIPRQLTFVEAAQKTEELDQLQKEVDVLNFRFGNTCVRPARSLADEDLADVGFQAWNSFAPQSLF